jgi:hypothetical protein
MGIFEGGETVTLISKERFCTEQPHYVEQLPNTVMD